MLDKPCRSLSLSLTHYSHTSRLRTLGVDLTRRGTMRKDSVFRLDRLVNGGASNSSRASRLGRDGS